MVEVEVDVDVDVDDVVQYWVSMDDHVVKIIHGVVEMFDMQKEMPVEGMA